MKSAILFIGRFQPFHNGHLSVIQDLIESIDEYEEDINIIIGIGSSQESGTEKNPFTFKERKEMITRTLKRSEDRYSIIPIPDINNYDKWVDHVYRCLREAGHDYNEFCVHSGNTLVLRLFNEKREVRWHTFEIATNFGPTATMIREMVVAKRSIWDLVPPQVREYLKEIDGEERIIITSRNEVI